MISPGQAFLKRTFDIVLAIVGLTLTGWLILIAWALATVDTRANGMFAQIRIGRLGRPFRVYKIRSMRPAAGCHDNDFFNDEPDWTSVTTAKDQRITRLGRVWRKTKIDELPQMVNVLLGQMSFVGPRPDVPGFADKLQGEDRIILTMRPGITGPATLKYRHEEEILAAVDDPEAYNRDVIFPDKVQLNSEYVKNWSLSKDLSYILQTVLRIGSIHQTSLAGDPTGQPRRKGLSWAGYLLIKRTMDIVIAAVGLIVLSPLMIAIGVLVRWKLGSPILFRQTRAGLNSKPFKLIKFRTMLNDRDSNGKLLPDGDRLTRFGQFLRSTSLDELPELWNILKGDMSLIGPRPLLMEYLPRYSITQNRRHEVKPGLTGWAQIQGRNLLDWTEKFKHDVWYVDHQSTWLDFKILVITIWKVATRQGISAEGQATMEPFLGDQAIVSTKANRAAVAEPVAHATDSTLVPPQAQDRNGFSLETVLSYINKVLTNSQRPLLSSVVRNQTLQQDLGLDSLELAELTVRIESETGVDIFAKGVIRTVGEILDKLEEAGSLT
jgi:lipopolysaccharide/colanic/teichoic acid biosynthesis glycosyltransferase/acyl carrier protein